MATLDRKSRRPAFGSASWVAHETAKNAGRFARRTEFSGLEPKEAAARIVAVLLTKKDLRRTTQEQRRLEMARILADLRDKGFDLATVTPAAVIEYRTYLAQCVRQDLISESYAASLTKTWNAVLRAAFGERSRPGEGLLMKSFRIRAKHVRTLTEEELVSLEQAAAHDISFRSEHNRAAFLTYLKVVQATGGRMGSFLTNLAAKDLDLDGAVVHFAHMKNKAGHDAVLTPKAVGALREWRAYLQTTRLWKGDATRLFTDKVGVPFKDDFINDALRRAAAAAGITKHVSSHVMRKSVGTIIGKKNPKYAALQLGISDKIFNAHYNMPSVEDRLDQREILPGFRRSSTPEELAGRALLAFKEGKITGQQFEAELEKAQRMTASPAQRSPESQGYA